MRPNSKQLSLRDPALASLLGAIKGSDFGVVDFGAFGYGSQDVQFGDEPTPAKMQAAWNEVQRTRQREQLLEPNKGSAAKIQRYTFGASIDLVLGVASTISPATMGQNPETSIRPQRVTANAPAPGFCILENIKVANVGVVVGGEIDAFDLSALAQDAALDVPTLTPANRVTVAGRYTGTVPPGFVGGATFTFIVSFKGPANMVA